MTKVIKSIPLRQEKSISQWKVTDRVEALLKNNHKLSEARKWLCNSPLLQEGNAPNSGRIGKWGLANQPGKFCLRDDAALLRIQQRHYKEDRKNDRLLRKYNWGNEFERSRLFSKQKSESRLKSGQHSGVQNSCWTATDCGNGRKDKGSTQFAANSI